MDPPADVLHQAAVEGLAGQVHVVLLRQLLLHVLVLEPPQVVALLLKPLNDLPHQGALNAIGLDLHPVVLLEKTCLLWGVPSRSEGSCFGALQKLLKGLTYHDVCLFQRHLGVNSIELHNKAMSV